MEAQKTLENQSNPKLKRIPERLLDMVSNYTAEP